MKQYFGMLTAAMFLAALPGTGWAQKDAGIPPMLETQRPLAMPASQPEPRAPQADLAKPASSSAVKGAKTNKAKGKTCEGGKTNLASQKKTTKAVKKKGATAKPRGKVAANR
jgi:hypothetical protein